MNYFDGVEVKMTPKCGRGMFATKNFKKGDVVIAEKAIASGTYGADLISKCSKIYEIKGAKAIRLSYLYNGGDKFTIIPNLEIFTKNTYRYHAALPDLEAKTSPISTHDQMKSITKFNRFTNAKEANRNITYIFGLKSLINHSMKNNLYMIN